MYDNSLARPSKTRARGQTKRRAAFYTPRVNSALSPATAAEDPLMPNHGHQPAPAYAPFDDDRAERIVMKAYLQLPLLSRQADGSWVAPLQRCGRCALRLIERVAATPAEPVLRVELLNLQTQTAIESRGCKEVEDAVAAFQAMIPVALTYTQASALQGEPVRLSHFQTAAESTRRPPFRPRNARH